MIITTAKKKEKEREREKVTSPYEKKEKISAESLIQITSSIKAR